MATTAPSHRGDGYQPVLFRDQVGCPDEQKLKSSGLATEGTGGGTRCPTCAQLMRDEREGRR